MFVVTNKPELAIWITPNPYNKKSGEWHFYNNEEEYKIDLGHFTHKYKSKSLITLKKVVEMYNSRSGGEDVE